MKIFLGLSLLALIGCAHHKERHGISTEDKKVWTCAGLHRSEKNEPLTEARDRLEIYRSMEIYKFIGYGAFAKINTPDHGSFKFISNTDNDEDFRMDGDLFKNSLGDSLFISNKDVHGPRSSALHLQGGEFEILCQEIH